MLDSRCGEDEKAQPEAANVFDTSLLAVAFGNGNPPSSPVSRVGDGLFDFLTMGLGHVREESLLASSILAVDTIDGGQTGRTPW